MSPIPGSARRRAQSSRTLAPSTPSVPVPSIVFPTLPWLLPFPVVVFCGHRGAPLQFAMPLSTRRPEIRRVVEKHGGVLDDPNRTDPANTRIMLLDMKHYTGQEWLDKAEEAVDAFSIQYVLDCAEQKKLLPNLRDYLVGETKFKGDYHPLEVARGDTDWSKLAKQLGVKEGAVQTPQKARAKKSAPPEGEICSDADFQDSERETFKDKSRLKLKTGRAPYLKTEQAEVIAYIIKKKAFGQLKGNQLWRAMEDGVCGGRRSWQSLKEHYRKTLRHNIKAFGLKKSDRENFVDGWNGDYVNEDSSDEEEDQQEEQDGNGGQQQDEEEEEEIVASEDNVCQDTGKGNSTEEESESGEESQEQSNPAIPNAQVAPSQDIQDDEDDSDGSDSDIVSPVVIVTPNKRAPKVKHVLHKRSEGLFKEVVDSGRRKRQADTSRLIAPSTSEESSSVEDSQPEDSPVQKRCQDLTKARPLTAPVYASSPSKSSSNDFVVKPTSPHRLGKKARHQSRSESATNEPAINEPAATDSPNETTFSQRNPYTYAEDETMKRYVEKKRLYHFHKGNMLYKQMEKDQVLPGRTWQSMKNRFLKHVAANVNSKKYGDGNASLAKEISMEKKFYSREEDETILRYILENNREKDVKGNALWELMYDRAVLERSAQSMKERYRKTILKHLGRYDITEAQRQKLG